MGMWWRPCGPGLQWVPERRSGGRDPSEDALHRHHGAESDQWQDRRGDRPRRWRDRADPAWADQGGMIEAPRIGCSGGTPSIVEWGPHAPRGPHSLWAIQV